MTFRPPATKPTRRRSRQLDSRRTVYFNIAFGLACLAALALLGSVLVGNYYSDHGAPIASVNGTAISKDAVRARANADQARASRLLSDYDLLRNQNKITTVEENQLASVVTTDPTTIYSNAMTQLTQELTLQQYADKHGISVSDADVNAQIVKDGTIPEMRHVKVIAVQPSITPPASVPTASDNTAAQTQLQGYLDSIKTGGKKWDDVYKTSTTGIQAPSSSGDLGLWTRDTLSLDPDLVDAIFSLKNVNDITGIFKGTDGIFRFATVTEILPPYVDTGWKDAIDQSGNGDEYHRIATGEAIRAKIQAQVEAQYVTGQTKARQVQEIFVASGYGQPGDGPEVKIRMIVFAPKHDTSQATTLDQSGPDWADAKSRADAAYATLQKDMSQFSVIAMDGKQNDDSYLVSTAGQFPWLPETIFTGSTSQQQGLGMLSVPAAIFKPGLAPGLMAPLLEPSMGWVIVDFQGSRPAPDQRIADAQLLLATGADFATVAQQYSEADDAMSGGDLGWVFNYQLSPDLQAAIFQAPVGGLSRAVQSSDGWHLYKILAEETRAPDATQQLTLKGLVFNTWLGDLTSETNIWTDSAGLTAITPTATP